MCSLLDALSTPTQRATRSANTRDSAEVDMNHGPVAETKTGATDGEDRRSAIPVALMTLGWDSGGSPLRTQAYGDCSNALLELPQIVQWFVSHEKGNYARPPKVSSKYCLLSRLSQMEQKRSWQISGTYTGTLHRSDATMADMSAKNVVPKGTRRLRFSGKIVIARPRSTPRCLLGYSPFFPVHMAKEKIN